MGAGAPRQPSRPWGRWSRGALLALCLWPAAPVAGVACESAPWRGVAMDGSLTELDGAAPRAGPVAAWYEDPTTRYAHGVLGDAVEAGTLAVQLDAFPNCTVGRVTLSESEVFEDIAPRLVDLDGDDRAEIIVVQSHARLGARLVIYGLGEDGGGLVERASTPNIGRSNRWLAPIGAADLNADGRFEVAFIDRPHLARTLRVWQFQNDTLTEIATLEGLTNHRIGEAFITGGVRECGGAPELITADTQWAHVIATGLSNSGLSARAIAPFSQSNVQAALACDL